MLMIPLFLKVSPCPHKIQVTGGGVIWKVPSKFWYSCLVIVSLLGVELYVAVTVQKHQLHSHDVAEVACSWTWVNKKKRKEKKNSEFHCIYLYIAVIILDIVEAAFLYSHGIFITQKYMNHAKIFFVSYYTNKTVVFYFEGYIFEEKYKSAPGIIQMTPINNLFIKLSLCKKI